MRLATSSNKIGSVLGSRGFGINVALSVASFVLGAVVSRPPLSAAASGAERELVSGASTLLVNNAVGVPSVGSQPVGSQPVGQPASAGAPPVAANAALEGRRGARAKEEAEPSWSQVAARAQSWTAAVRADLNYGAGVIVDRSGLVLTNLHVVANARAISITPFGGGDPLPARVLDSDVELDLALLSATVPNPLPDAARLGSAVALGVGDEVLAVGSPRKMYFSVSRGMVSFPNRLLEGVEYVQTDLPINEGNSGGPLVNREGRVVGIVSFILRESQGLSFALPIDLAIKRFADQLTSSAAPAPATVGQLRSRELPSRELPSRELPSREPPPPRAH
ncbi:MAG: trypsin-like peptidase domain-containing protein [Deltaproteobacteria bacterium]